MYSLIAVKHVKQKKVLVLCDSIGKYLDGIRDGVIQSFRIAVLGYIKYIIDTEYLYDINRFSHIILYFE